MDRQATIDRFLTDTGWANAARKQVAGDASNRKYDRLSKPDGTTAILMDAPPETGEDVRPFVTIADHLRKSGLSTPAIYHQDPDAGLLLIEDFGDALFADLMAADPSKEIPLYQAAADVLIHLGDAETPSLQVCDTDWLSTMIEPVFEWYTPDTNAQSRSSFTAHFSPLALRANTGKQVLILRDYHAQNLLLLPERTGIARVGLLDFQDAMIGHPAYDLVSILQDARRDVSPEVESEIIRYMLAQIDADPAEFRTVYAILGLQRNLRILGIFARLCLRDGKASYVDLIPRVWAYIQRNLAHPELAPLKSDLNQLLPTPTPLFLEHMNSLCPPQPIPS
jgi:aminoglycoside/choline kinase family phosphotransferase